MAFTATYTFQLNHNPLSPPVTVAQANCYFRLSEITGGKDVQSWWTKVQVFANEETRNNDLSDFIPGEEFPISAPYVEGQDPYAALYDAAKINYPDAVDV